MNNQAECSNSGSSCTEIVSVSSEEENSTDSHIVNKALTIEKEPNAEQSAEMVEDYDSLKQVETLKATEVASAQRDVLEHVTSENAPAKKGKCRTRSTRKRQISTAPKISPRPERSKKAEGMNNTKIMLQNTAVNFDDEEFSPDEEAVELTKAPKNVKKVRTSDPSPKICERMQRNKRNNSESDVSPQSSTASPSSAPMKIFIPINLSKSKSKKLTSDFESIKKQLPAKVRTGMDQLLKTVDASRFDIEGHEYEGMDVEIRMEDESEKAEEELEEMEEELEEGEITQPSSVEKTISSNETVQDDIVETTERQRSNASPSTSSDATRVVADTSQKNAEPTNSQVPTAIQKLMGELLNDFAKDHFDAAVLDCFKRPEMQQFLHDTLKKALKSLLLEDDAALLEKALHKYVSNLDSFFVPNDEREKE